MRVALVIASMRGGGAERVMSTLANAWARAGHEVTLITLSQDPSAYPLEASVTLRPLGVNGASHGRWNALRANVARVTALRSALRAARPRLAVSFMERTNILTLAAVSAGPWGPRLSVPVVVSERLHPDYLGTSPLEDAVRAASYRRAARIVVQTRQVAAAMPSSSRARLEVIPNPVLRPSGPAVTLREPTVVAAGRLVRQKGFDLLIDAFARVAPSSPGWRLEIFGDGPERSTLERRVEARGLAGRARLAGRTDRLERELARASVFALSSRFEGFPNVLCEAMACGTPVVATRCPSGPEDVVRDGVDGLLVPTTDPGALSDALARLISDAPLRERLGGRAREVADRFSVSEVLGRWDRVMREVTA